MPLVEIRMPDEEKEGTEAFLGTWLKQAGDPVSEHEPLVEISTDKVTIEVATPASGTLGLHRKKSGDAVRPGDLLGTIDTDDPVTAASQRTGDNAVLTIAPKQSNAAMGTQASSTDPATRLVQDEARTTFSPVVRRLLKELGLDPLAIPKVSRGGRLTPEDLRVYLSAPAEAQQVSAKLASTPQASLPDVAGGRKVPHTPMRRSIASHMVRSVQAAPHVTSVFEADLYNVLADREARKQINSGESVPSITAYLIYAALQAIKVVPEVNSRWHDTHLEIFDYVHFGIGTALDTGGLVVPVLRDAQKMDLMTLAHRLREMTTKARSGKLTHDDMEGGTFTLSNHGVSGSLLAAPIILPHGQAAILGAGKMQKRVIVCETGGRELFRVRPMMYVTLTVDHRVLDGQQTNKFLTAFVAALENPEAS